MERLNRSVLLLALLLGTLLLGLLYLFTVPPGYGPDEPSHFGYVRFLAEGRGWPVLGATNDPRGPTYEAHQPPLYYMAAVPFYLAGRGIAGEHGAWLGVRFFTLLCGLGTVALVYRLARRLFPDEPSVAVGAGAFAGFLPSQAALFAVVSNDPLTELGFTLAFVLLARYLLGNGGQTWLPLWIGLAAGLTLLTKYSALILLGVLPLAMLFASRSDEQKGMQRFRPFLLFALGASVCLPWLVRNQIVYGDPLGWAAFSNYFQTVMDSPTPHSLAQRMRVEYSPAWYWLEAVGGWSFRDSLGMWLFSRPGQPVPVRIALPVAFYALWGILWLAAVAGGLRFLFTEWTSRSREWRGCILGLALSFLLLLIAYLRLNAVFYWAHSRYLFPAVAAMALLWAVGLSRWMPERYRLPTLGGIGGLLFLIAIFAGFALLGGYFEAASTTGGL